MCPDLKRHFWFISSHLEASEGPVEVGLEILCPQVFSFWILSLEHAFLCHLLLRNIALLPLFSCLSSLRTATLYFPWIPKAHYTGGKIYCIFYFYPVTLLAEQSHCFEWPKGSWDLFGESRSWIWEEYLLAIEGLLQNLPTLQTPCFSPGAGSWTLRLGWLEPEVAAELGVLAWLVWVQSRRRSARLLTDVLWQRFGCGLSCLRLFFWGWFPRLPVDSVQLWVSVQ